MRLIHNFLVNKFSINIKANKAKEKLLLKENDFVFTINDFAKALSFYKLKNNFGLFNINDFFSLQNNLSHEFETLSRKLTADISQKLEDKKVIISFDFTFIKDGLFIISFPSNIKFSEKTSFYKELQKKMFVLYMASNSKKSFENLINTHFVEREAIKIENALNLIECRDNLIEFITNTVKSSKN